MGAKLLQDVRQDLADVVQVCEGKKKQTNYLRTLINELVKGTGPPGVPRGPAPHVRLTGRRAGRTGARWLLPSGVGRSRPASHTLPSAQTSL